MKTAAYSRTQGIAKKEYLVRNGQFDLSNMDIFYGKIQDHQHTEGRYRISSLDIGGIGQPTHDDREYGTAHNRHNHQGRSFLCFRTKAAHTQCENGRKHNG